VFLLLPEVFAWASRAILILLTLAGPEEKLSHPLFKSSCQCCNGQTGRK
jgi:hypothetical protein